jgi:hypothetical protein
MWGEGWVGMCQKEVIQEQLIDSGIEKKKSGWERVRWRVL